MSYLIEGTYYWVRGGDTDQALSCPNPEANRPAAIAFRISELMRDRISHANGHLDYSGQGISAITLPYEDFAIFDYEDLNEVRLVVANYGIYVEMESRDGNEFQIALDDLAIEPPADWNPAWDVSVRDYSNMEP